MSILKKLGEALGLAPVERFSTAYLAHLLNIIERNPLVTLSNVDMMVETVREIAELVTWGDKHDALITEFFMEKRMLEKLLGFLEPSRRTAKPMKVQILQSLSIFFQNLNNSSLIFYLLSNDHVNELITHRFDFQDEELMAYYISFLKALSLRVNADTVHFFFNARKTPEFPLLTEALKFYNHDDHMVRVAVRTLTLNIYGIEDVGMREYIANRTAVPFFSNIVWEMIRRYRELDSLLTDAMFATSPRETKPIKYSVEKIIQEQIDNFYYINDIMCCGFPALRKILGSRLLHKLVVPMSFESIRANRRGSKKPEDYDEKAHENALSTEPLQLPAALLIAAQTLGSVQDKDLSEFLIRSLFANRDDDPEVYFPQIRTPTARRSHAVNATEGNATEGARPGILVAVRQEVMQESIEMEEKSTRGKPPHSSMDEDAAERGPPNTCRPVILTNLSADEDHAVLMILTCVLAAIQKGSASPAVLEECGLLPTRCRKKRSKEENLQEEGEISRGDEGKRLVEGGGESAVRGVATWSYETNHVKHVNVETPGLEDSVLESPEGDLTALDEHQIGYNSELVVLLLGLLARQAERRFFTATLAANILLELTHPCGSAIPSLLRAGRRVPRGLFLLPQHACILLDALQSAVHLISDMLKFEDGDRSHLFICIAEEQLGKDNGLSVVKEVDVEAILTDAILILPPFVGNIPAVPPAKTLPKAEIDFLRHKAQMWILLRFLHDWLCGGVEEEEQEEEEEERNTRGTGRPSSTVQASTTMKVGACINNLEEDIQALGVHRICLAYEQGTWVFRYLLVDQASMLLVAPDARGDIAKGVVTQVIPLRDISSSTVSTSNAHLLEIQLKDPIAAATSIANGSPSGRVTRYFRLQFDEPSLCVDCASYINDNVRRVWKERRERVLRLLAVDARRG